MFTKSLNNNRISFTQKLLLTVFLYGLHASSLLAQSCGDFLTSNTTLSGDLNCTSGYYALEIGADNITLDLNGYTLSGTSSLAGVIVDSRSNVTIKNGVIKGFWAGVNSVDTSNLQILDNVFYNLGEGIVLSAGSDAYISGNDFIKTSSRGVAIVNYVFGMVAMDNVVADNEFYMTRIGVEICGLGTASNTIKGNLIWQSMDYGISLRETNDNQLYDNTVLETGYLALRVDNATHNIITGNSLRVGDVGLAIYGGGSSGGACVSSGVAESHDNVFKGNHSIGFNVGVMLGLGAGSAASVYDNNINYNKIYDDNTGILFNTDAHNNNAKGNAYSGTMTPIVDMGVGNVY